jgi:hypothetical protein
MEIQPTDTVLKKVVAKTYKAYQGFMVHTECFYPKGIDAA